MTRRANQTVVEGRETVKRILNLIDPRLLIIVGPCSIHDAHGALEYARKLNRLREELFQKIPKPLLERKIGMEMLVLSCDKSTASPR